MNEGALLFLQALTSLHPGAGTALDVIDLPIQRERHTHWPLLPSSSLKGVLRSTTRPKTPEERATWQLVFGPETNEAHKHAGSLVLTDARMLAFPVRSLKGIFALVTCPAVLQRFRRDVGLCLPFVANSFPSIPKVSTEEILCLNDRLVIDQKSVMLEEFDFSWSNSQSELLQGWAVIFERLAFSSTAIASMTMQNFAILSDDDFSHFVRYATEVSARIGLDYETKTVRTGALFYQETLPPESLFYSVVLGEERCANGQSLTSQDVMNWLNRMLPEYIQVGGDETIGRGLCATRLVQALED